MTAGNVARTSGVTAVAPYAHPWLVEVIVVIVSLEVGPVTANETVAAGSVQRVFGTVEVARISSAMRSAPPSVSVHCA